LFLDIACFLCISCSSETNLSRAQAALKKGNFEQVLKIVDVPTISEFREWGIQHVLLGSKARSPKKNKAELAEEELVLENENIKIQLMLQAMFETKNVQVSDYLQVWYECFTITPYHVEFAANTLQSSGQTLIVIPSKVSNIIMFRLACYNRQWTEAYTILSEKFEDTSNDDFFSEKPPIFLHDIANAILYGAPNKLTYAKDFSKAAATFNPNSTESFFCHFYSGKIYNLCDVSNRTESLREFKFAMNSTNNPALYDSALWYYLTISKNNSTLSAINALLEFASTWNDASWFDDFLDDLATTLLTSSSWDTFYSIYKFIGPYASDMINSKYAYIAGRLLQDKLTTESETDTPQAITNAFLTAWNAQNGKLYYRLMAADKLSISPEQVLEQLTKQNNNWTIQNDDATVKEIQYLFKTHKYSQVLSTYTLNRFHISTENAFKIAQDLENTTASNLNLYPESLRIFVAAINASDKTLGKQELSFLYPQYYSTFVSENSKKYNFPEYYLYALIRSESFFDADIVSYADAVGLTQLLESTAADMARKLHINEYDITTPEDNILLGTHYIQELYQRLDNSYSLAFFSYNGGISRVRRWKDEWQNLSPDLFLEVLPLSQTREYGRKIASAAAMYGMLYYNKTTHEVLEELFNN
jgi:soluble lytic murein transglycosylase